MVNRPSHASLILFQIQNAVFAKQVKPWIVCDEMGGRRSGRLGPIIPGAQLRQRRSDVIITTIGGLIEASYVHSRSRTKLRHDCGHTRGRRRGRSRALFSNVHRLAERQLDTYMSLMDLCQLLNMICAAAEKNGTHCDEMGSRRSGCPGAIIPGAQLRQRRSDVTITTIGGLI